MHEGFTEHHARRLVLIEELLLALASEIATLTHQGNHIMSGLTELRAAVVALQASVAAAADELSSLATQLTNSTSGDPDSDVGQLAQQIQAQVSRLNQAVTDSTPVSGGPGSGPTGDTGATGATGDTGPAS